MTPGSGEWCEGWKNGRRDGRGRRERDLGIEKCGGTGRKKEGKYRKEVMTREGEEKGGEGIVGNAAEAQGEEGKGRAGHAMRRLRHSVCYKPLKLNDASILHCSHMLARTYAYILAVHQSYYLSHIPITVSCLTFSYLFVM